MTNLSEELKRKCINLWNNRTKTALRFPELKNDGHLTEEEIQYLSTYIKWTNRQNCCEIIGAIALDLSSDLLKCKITNLDVHFSVPFYRIYSTEEILNKCFRLTGKNLAKHKWKWDLCFNYNRDALEELCTNATMHNIFKCPMMINHCYVWLRDQEIDINLISNAAEAVYLWKNKLKKLPLCPITGEKLNFSTGQYTSHSRQGANILNGLNNKGKVITEEQINKTRETNLKKYGVSAYVLLADARSKSAESKKVKAEERKKARELELLKNPPPSRKEKYQKTMTERYGGPTMKDFLKKNPRTKESNKKATEKSKQTWLEKYGTDNPQELSQIRNKIKQTNIEKYGYACYLNTPEQKKSRARQDNIKTYNNFNRFANYCTPIFTLEQWLADTKASFEWKLTKTGETYEARYWGYAPHGRFQHSLLERTIHELLESWGCGFITSDRQTISPKELDIFIPSANIAIECNGEFFHSDQRLGRNYHDEKRKECESNNIQLLQFFGWEIQRRPKAVKSVIKNALKLNSYKIHARKTKVCQVPSLYARKFYEKYHIHGFCGASVHYGLSLNGKIVQMLSIGTARFEKNCNDKEIIRSATIYNFNVIGGLSKLISVARKDFLNCDIHTYVDLACFSGKGYEASGFVYQHTTPPSYYYFKGERYPIYSRYQTQKHKLKKLLGSEFDPSKTEQENMKAVGYYKVFRCSHKHYVIKK